MKQEVHYKLSRSQSRALVILEIDILTFERGTRRRMGILQTSKSTLGAHDTHCARALFILRNSIPDFLKRIQYSYYTGWAKSQFTYVGLNSSVTECSIEIILSGMTYYMKAS